MKSKTLPIFLITIFIIIFYIFYKGLQNSNIYTPDVNIKKDIPNFKTKVFDINNIINSNEIFKENKFYLVNVWASWCIPCREEHVFLMKLYKKKNLEIIGINYKDKNDNAKSFLNELGNPYKLILLDQDGTIAIEWGAYGVPETFLVYQKKIIKKIIGPINNNSLLEIQKLIK
jgi:cytochrome c biogenesis protein CcmG, thiol:disulfide interchange protein DsbE